jgi:ferredoxin
VSVRGYIRPRDLWGIVDRLAEQGVRVVAPTRVEGTCLFGEVTSSKEVVTDYLLPQNTFKEFIFPKEEQVLTYIRNPDGGYALTAPPRTYPETVILGGRPCDAAGIAVSLKSVFSGQKWGHEDALFLERLAVTTIVSISCDKPDLSCFCTSMGLGPDDRGGSDVLLTLTEAEDPVFVVEALNDKGQAFVERLGDVVRSDHEPRFLYLMRREAGEAARERFVRVFDIERVKDFLDDPSNFDDEMYARLGTKCISCGVCTFECPTCHCFDFKDVGTPDEGTRLKVWDSCQFPDFTLHATGHQPRPHPWERYRNRFLCKFKIYEDTFETPGCTGCGRCVRDCPVHVDITSYAMQAGAKQRRLLEIAT